MGALVSGIDAFLNYPRATRVDACLAGSLSAYLVGAYDGRPLLERYGKYIRIRESELDRADMWFEEYGDITVFVSRMLPAIRTFISLPAGIARMDVTKFSL